MKGIATNDSVEARATRAMRGTIGRVMAAIRLKSMPNSDALAQHRDHHHRQHDDGKRQHDVDNALDPVVDAAAEIAGRRAQQRAQRAAGNGRQDADRQRRARAVDDAREDVAAVLVGAEPVLRARRRQHRCEIDRLGIVGRDPLCAESADDVDEDDDEGPSGRAAGSW